MHEPAPALVLSELRQELIASSTSKSCFSLFLVSVTLPRFSPAAC